MGLYSIGIFAKHQGAPEKEKSSFDSIGLPDLVLQLTAELVPR